MFLATTALSEFWDKGQETLFLGPWCRREDRRPEWESLRGDLLPSPWDDPERYHRAAGYVEGVYERALERLAGTLNSAHGLRLSSRYWRILLGPWLMHYLHALYDRWVHIEEALRSNPGLTTILLDPACYAVPASGRQFFRWILEDRYNLQLFSEILVFRGGSYPTRRLAPEPGEGSTPHRGPRIAGAIREAGAAVPIALSRLLMGWGEVGIAHADIDSSSLWKLSLSTGLRAIPLYMDRSENPDPAEPLFDSRRKGLASQEGGDDFEKLFAALLPRNLPTCCLEGFAAARAKAQAEARRTPPVLLSAYGWYFHEQFQFLAAETAERGGKLLAAQHGGGYGVYRLAPQEQHELKIADRFLAWGWGNGNGDRTENIPSPKLSRLAGPRRPSAAVLFVATTNPRYFYRFYSSPQAAQLADYFRWQRRFLQALPETARSSLLFRCHPEDFGHKTRQRLSAGFPWLRWDGNRPFRKAVSETDLVLIDHLGTSLLEAAAADLPLVAWWNPSHWAVREEAHPFFDRLLDAGILWHDPERAAAHAAAVWADPRAWWSRPEVQDARRRLVERFARGGAHWEQEWAGMLRRQARLPVMEP